MSDRRFPIEPNLTLTEGERLSPLWMKLRTHLESRLASLRARNDGPMTNDETLALRGQIKCLKEVLALGKEPPVIDGM